MFDSGGRMEGVGELRQVIAQSSSSASQQLTLGSDYGFTVP